jgi:transketolase C-terminal domain/subunit
MAQLKIIDVSCPRQMLSIMQWIMEGNRGMLYVRVMRTASAVLYDNDFSFKFGKGWTLLQSADDAAVIISSGRGVHEALDAATECAKGGVRVGVVDMPSIDEELLLQLFDSGKPLLIAEQNNGYIWQNFLKVLYRNRTKTELNDLRRVSTINTLAPDGRPRFIHSGTYEELVEAFGLGSPQLAKAVREQLADLKSK